MPRSDTGPSGLEMMGEMDSADSCDSVLSMNSCFSDDSLQYLSAEEKACLMFLEETIESLATEDDSGLSTDEAESLPGSMATRAAHLSASIDQHKDAPKLCADDPRMFGESEHNQILNYLVPTPFALANSNAHMPPKSGTAGSKEDHKDSPYEVNVVVIPPPFPGKGSTERGQGLQNDQAPRGPLTYEGLVQLRKRVASRKATGDDKHPSTNSNDGPNLQRRETQSSKTNPPAVAPKPRSIPSHIAVQNHKEATDASADSTMHCLSTSPGSRGLMKPEKVRLEALSKLGLLKPSTNVQPTDGHAHSLLQSSSGSAPDLSQSRPRSSSSQELGKQPSQRSSVLHHRTMSDLPTVPARSHTKPAEGKAATLERSGIGLSKSNYELSDCQSSGVSQNHLQCSSTVVNLGNVHTDRTALSAQKPKAASRQPSIAPPVPQKPARGPSVNVKVVPNMGEDRREALRKLGLLKC